MATAVIKTAWHAWRSAMQACFGMPVVFAVALLLSLVYSAVVLVLKPEAAGGLEVASLLYMVATNAVEAFLMTPLVVDEPFQQSRVGRLVVRPGVRLRVA